MRFQELMDHMGHRLGIRELEDETGQRVAHVECLQCRMILAVAVEGDEDGALATELAYIKGRRSVMVYLYGMAASKLGGSYLRASRLATERDSVRLQLAELAKILEIAPLADDIHLGDYVEKRVIRSLT